MDLPQPEAPTITSISPSCQRQIDVVQDGGVAEAFGEAGQFEGRHYFSPSVSPATNQRCISTTTMHRRQQRQHGGGHHRAPVGLRFDADHPHDADDDGVEPRVGRDQQRPENWFQP